LCYVAHPCKRWRKSVLARFVPPGWRAPIGRPLDHTVSISV
jgi:hypothetical protein